MSGEFFVDVLRESSDLGPILGSNIEIDSAFLPSPGVAVLAVLFRAGDPVGLASLNVNMVATSLIASPQRPAASVDCLSGLEEGDTENPRRAIVIMSVTVCLQLDIHDARFHSDVLSPPSATDSLI